MTYNISTGSISNSSNIPTQNNVKFPPKSSDVFTTELIVDFSAFTGAPPIIDNSLSFPKIAINGSHPSNNSGVFIINPNIIMK